MKSGGFWVRLLKSVSALVGHVTPTGVGHRFFLAGALVVLALLIANIETGREWSVIAWILCTAAVLLLLGLYRSIETRLERVCESIESIGLGDLSGRAEHLLEGETGRVIESVKLMNQGLTDIVEQVRVSADKIRSTAREIASGSGHLSHRTEEQASTLEEIASSMQELAATVRQNSEHCQTASKLTSESAELATRGAGMVRHAVDSMARVDESSRKIGEISKLIESIALQTNILALNAAVEAARAGDHGRGFAVVASEVRALAQRCSDAALDIKKLIESSVTNMSEGVAIVNDAGGAIERVAQSVRQSAALIGEIAAASRDQSSGVEQVSQSVTQLEQVNVQNAALVEQTAAATRLFDDEVGKLQQVVGGFKVDRAEGRQTAFALVRKGVAHLKAVGKRRACDDFDDPDGEFVFGEYYISAFDINGVRIANGSDPKSRGEHILDSRDADGKHHVRAIIEKAKKRGKGWEDYKWMNPVTRRIEPKSVYFELIDDAVVTCGIYRSEEVATKERPRSQLTVGSLLPPALPRQRRRAHTAATLER
ncbi:MAG: hypothetical protein C5B46_02030 [Proteobacteria bacterium]|nr:MAG: hypothetical protein C5B46_02030 [Pseudomonadota bacterium]